MVGLGDTNEPDHQDETTSREWKTIPGETPIDPSGLKIKGVTTRGELNVAEAENIRKAFVKYFASKPSKKLAPFSEAWLCKLHQDMFGDVWEWAGQYRNRDLTLGDAWQQLPQNIAALLEDLRYRETHDTDLLEQAVRLHYRAVTIHPFSNGNGRWARTLANVWLMQHDHPITNWPDNLIGRESPIRSEYIDALKAAEMGDYTSLTKLHQIYTEQSNQE